MKSKVSCLLVGVFLIADPVVAQAAQFGDFEYESSGTEVTITGYTGAGGAVTIPDSILGLPVTSIGAGAFGECTGLTSIEMEAFWTCTNLTSVRFEGNAPSLVGSDVFAGDDNATVYYLPGTTGWGPTFGGRPTAVWTQLVDIPDPGLLAAIRVALSNPTGDDGPEPTRARGLSHRGRDRADAPDRPGER